MFPYDITRWNIWSIEHHAWWAPNARGYTINREEAGEYTFEVACQIVADANRDLSSPNEAMVAVCKKPS